MVSKTLGLSFYLKKRRDYESGPLPIYLRITVDGKRAEISAKRYCDDPDKWNSSSGRINGNKESTKTVNNHLEFLQNRVYSIHTELLQKNISITADLIKGKLLGVEDKPRMLLEIFKQHNEQIEALVGNGFAPLTVERYQTSLKHTKEFIEWKYRETDLEIQKLDFELISDYYFYLRSKRKCGHNTTVKYLKNFKKIVLQCVKRGWLNKDPFYGFNLATKEVEREFLTLEELDLIMSKQFSTDRVQIARDIFVFSCYTGLAYIDVKKLNYSDITIGIDGQKWIYSRRQKTETPFRIPLLPVPLEILERYKDHPRRVVDDKALPVSSNQKLNEYLKDIAGLCGIRKKLTYHMARHTFATTITLNNDVPIETVSKLLGHKSLKITQHYAKTLDRKVSNDMMVLRQKLSPSNENDAEVGRKRFL
jgi:integrase